MLLTPHFVAGLAHFEASHLGPYGLIRSAGKKNGAAVFYSIAVPPNATATLRLPVPAGQAVYEAGRPLAASLAGIRVVKATGQLREYQLIAGTYQFAIR